MARTFTVLFHHDHREYTAIVSQLRDSVCIYIPDQSLHHILPQGRFSYETQKGPNLDSRSRSPVQALMQDVLAAIELLPKP